MLITTSAKPSLRWLFYLLTTILSMASIILYLTASVEPSIAFLGLAIVWTSLLPSLIYLSGLDRAPIPFFPVVGIFYALFFGMPVFTLPLVMDESGNIILYGITIIDEIRGSVLVTAWAGVAAMIALFYASKFFLFRYSPQLRLARDMDDRILKIFYWLLLAAHLIYRFAPEIRSLPSIGQFLEPIGFVGLCGLYLQWRRGRLSVTEKLALSTVFVPLIIFSRIKLLFITEILLFAIFVGFIFWRERQFKSIAILTPICIAIVSFYTATTTVRGAYENPTDKILVSLKVYAKLVFTGEEIVHTVDRNGKSRSFGGEGRSGALARRTSHLWLFHRVADLSPDTVPYWRGETYTPLLTSMVPRLFYTDKPEERSGYNFGRRYQILNHALSATSLNLPWMIEMLANFGAAGVLAGMSLIGLFLAAMERLFNADGMNDAEFSVGLALILPLVYPESNLSVMAGSLPLFFVSIFMCFMITSRISRWLIRY